MSEQNSRSYKDASEGIVEDQQHFYIYGMYFCGVCKNVMTPSKEAGEKLEFNCKQCGKKQIDFTNSRDAQCIIYNKELKPGSRKDTVTKQYVFDQTMPLVEIQCPECGCEEAVYFITPDEGQTCLEVKLICKNVIRGRCDYDWVLGPGDALFTNGVIAKEDLQEGGK